MTEILTFQQALDDSTSYSKRHLLLGNGFSIECCPDIFHYGSLFQKSDFGKHEELRLVFQHLGTEDFETVIRNIEGAATLIPIYAPLELSLADRLTSDALALKEILVQTIAGNHPNIPFEIPEEKFFSCQQFLSHFLGSNFSGQVFTLNYDLLLYWTLMHQEKLPLDQPLLAKNDGFGNDEDDPNADYVVWQGETGAHSARIHFLHGALHLFDAGNELQKFTWIRTDNRLIDQARSAISGNKFPLFVSEGTSEQKKRKIRHNAYLYQGFKQLTANAQTGTHCFFVHGHSLADNDNHILFRLGRGRFKKLYVSLFGDPQSDGNKKIIRKAEELATLRSWRAPLAVAFYDSASAEIWKQ